MKPVNSTMVESTRRPNRRADVQPQTLEKPMKIELDDVLRQVLEVILHLVCVVLVGKMKTNCSTLRNESLLESLIYSTESELAQ